MGSDKIKETRAELYEFYCKAYSVALLACGIGADELEGCDHIDALAVALGVHDAKSRDTEIKSMQDFFTAMRKKLY